MSADDKHKPKTVRKDPNPKLLECLKELVNRSGGTIIKVCGIEKTVNLDILAFHSPKIRKLLQKKDRVKAMENLNPTIFEKVIDYAYTYVIKLTVGNVAHVYEVAKTLKMKELEKSCYEYIEEIKATNSALHGDLSVEMKSWDFFLLQTTQTTTAARNDEREDCQQSRVTEEDAADGLFKRKKYKKNEGNVDVQVDILKQMEIEQNENVKYRENNMTEMQRKEEYSSHRLSVGHTNEIDGDLPNQFSQYDMKSKPPGYFVVFNYEKFYNVKDGSGIWAKNDRLTRGGTKKDSENLINAARNLGFSSCHVLNDCSRVQTLSYLDRLARSDHSGYSCFGCAILTHGGNSAAGDYLTTSDGKQIYFKEFVEPFTAKSCRSLFGKPKLFFIQACRGSNTDEGTKGGGDVGNSPTVHRSTSQGTEEEELHNENALPSEPDFFFAYSVVRDHYSFRSQTLGSYFVQYLKECFVRVQQSEELLQVVTTTVNKKMAGFVSHADRSDFDNKKQMSSITSQLRADVKFNPKRPQQELPPATQYAESEDIVEVDVAHTSQGGGDVVDAGGWIDEDQPTDNYSYQSTGAYPYQTGSHLSQPAPFDASVYQYRAFNASSSTNTQPNEEKYVQRGSFVILNFQNFGNDSRSKNRMKDIADLKKTAINVLGFATRDVIVVNEELSNDQIKLNIDEIAEKVQGDGLILIILTYGGMDGIVRLHNTEEMKLEEFMKPFQADNCRQLFGKPKLIFVQACEYIRRAKVAADGVDLVDNNAECDKSKWLPTHADFLIASSTAPEFYTSEFETEAQGTTFIQTLCQEFREFGDKREIMEMLTAVNRTVVAKKRTDHGILHSPKFTTQLRGGVHFASGRMSYDV